VNAHTELDPSIRQLIDLLPKIIRFCTGTPSVDDIINDIVNVGRDSSHVRRTFSSATGFIDHSIRQVAGLLLRIILCIAQVHTQLASCYVLCQHV
jgi:hypothetical protein